MSCITINIQGSGLRSDWGRAGPPRLAASAPPWHPRPGPPPGPSSAAWRPTPGHASQLCLLPQPPCQPRRGVPKASVTARPSEASPRASRWWQEPCAPGSPGPRWTQTLQQPLHLAPRSGCPRLQVLTWVLTWAPPLRRAFRPTGSSPRRPTRRTPAGLRRGRSKEGPVSRGRLGVASSLLRGVSGAPGSAPNRKSGGESTPFPRRGAAGGRCRPVGAAGTQSTRQRAALGQGSGGPGSLRTDTAPTASTGFPGGRHLPSGRTFEARRPRGPSTGASFG